MTPEDSAWLFHLHEAAHRQLVEAAYGPWDTEQQISFFEPVIKDHDVRIITDDQVDVGAVYLGTRDGDNWIELIEVDPARQSQGIGAAALRQIVAQGQNQGRGTLLQVHRINTRAQALYQREGFDIVGETQTHYLMRCP